METKLPPFYCGYMSDLVQGDYVAIRQLDGNFSSSRDFALLPFAQSGCAARFVRIPFDVWGYVKYGTGVQQPRVCVAQCSGLLQSLSSLVREFLWIWNRQH